MTDPMPTILDILRGPPKLDQTRISTNPLPSNWVGVTFWPNARGSGYEDATEQWTGEVLAEDGDTITLAVFGEPMTFKKRDCVIRRTT